MNSSLLNAGEVITLQNIVLFLGNRNSSISDLSSTFRHLNFQALKQTHGDTIFHSTVQTQKYCPEADAHWSKDQNLALCISTADCLPVFVFDPAQGVISAIHAGWRGIENRIIMKTIERISRECGINTRDLFAYIGPHLQMSSFEIENSIRDKILETVSPQDNLFRETQNGKSLVDLHEVAKKQMLSMGLLKDRILGRKIDTRSDLGYHSFRRDRELSGRQVSFIAFYEGAEQL